MYIVYQYHAADPITVVGKSKITRIVLSPPVVYHGTFSNLTKGNSLRKIERSNVMYLAISKSLTVRVI